MNKVITLIIFAISCINLAAFSQSGSVGIGTSTPHTSAVLEVQSTDKGMLIPRMTSMQRTSIATPAAGLLVFDNTTGTFWFYNGNAWKEISGNNSNPNWASSGSHIYNSNPGNVGIGTSTPNYDLTISRPSPSIGFFDTANNHASGLITGDSANLEISAYKRPPVDQNDPGNLILQVNSDAIFPSPSRFAGRVGIGKNNPSEKLDVYGDIQLSGKLMHSDTRSANMIPICYGVIDANGNILSGTQNFTATRVDTGKYQITLIGLSPSSPSILVSGNQLHSINSVLSSFLNGTFEIHCLALDYFDIGLGIPPVFLGLKLVDMKFSFVIYQA